MVIENQVLAYPPHHIICHFERLISVYVFDAAKNYSVLVCWYALTDKAKFTNNECIPCGNQATANGDEKLKELMASKVRSLFKSSEMEMPFEL